MTRLAVLFTLAAPALLMAAPPATAGQGESAGARCGNVPQLILDSRSALPSTLFGEETPAFRATAANLGSAYARACRDGLTGVFRSGGGLLRLRNDLETRVARIHPVSVRGARGLDGVVLRYPFVAADGTVGIPTADEIHEAIYCRWTSASTSQREAGRCRGE